MAFILDHLQPVVPVFREPKFWKLHLNTFAQFFSENPDLAIIFRTPGSHFPGTGKSFSGNQKVIFWELERNLAIIFRTLGSHFLGTGKSFSRNLKETLLSFSGHWEVIFREPESHFLGTWKSFSGNRKVIFRVPWTEVLEVAPVKIEEGLEVWRHWGARVLRCEGLEVRRSWGGKQLTSIASILSKFLKFHVPPDPPQSLQPHLKPQEFTTLWDWNKFTSPLQCKGLSLSMF